MKFIEKHKKAILVAFFFFIASKIKNKSIMPINGKFTENDAKEALLRFAQKNKERAKLLEKMYRAETNHFRSDQYKLTGTAGMEDGSWGKHLKKYFPNGYTTIPMRDNGTKEMKNFVVWNNLDNFLQLLSDYIDRYNGDYLRWNAKNEPKYALRRQKYQTLINGIKNRFII
jgi:hypothetical protein